MGKSIVEKKRSKIIIDIIKGDIDVAQALEILDLLLEDIKDEKIKKWVNCEINGYKSKEKIPEYRIVNVNIFGTLKTYTHVVSNDNIPVPYEYAQKLGKAEIRDGINELLQMAKAETESESHSLQIPLDLAYINAIASVNGEITHARRDLGVYSYTNIIGKLKSKLLSIFKELERQYGNLDNYYIDFRNDSKEKDFTQYITNIIFDKSITVGNDNEISESIIGDENGN